MAIERKFPSPYEYDSAFNAQIREIIFPDEKVVMIVSDSIVSDWGLYILTDKAIYFPYLRSYKRVLLSAISSIGQSVETQENYFGPIKTNQIWIREKKKYSSYKLVPTLKFSDRDDVYYRFLKLSKKTILQTQQSWITKFGFYVSSYYGYILVSILSLLGVVFCVFIVYIINYPSEANLTKRTTLEAQPAVIAGLLAKEGKSCFRSPDSIPKIPAACSDIYRGFPQNCFENVDYVIPKIRGKVFFWDAVNDVAIDTYPHSSQQFALSLSDAQTIVLVISVRDVPVKTYSPSGRKGFRVEEDICIINWPNKEVAGVFRLEGGEPPDIVPLMPIGKITGGGPSIVQWIWELMGEP